MLLSTRLVLTLGLAGGLVTLPSLSAKQKEPDESGVQEAIRFERAKQAAADRQARIEEGRTADRSAMRSKKKGKATHKATSASNTAKATPAQHYLGRGG